MRFFTGFDRPEKVLEAGGGPSKTELAGYVPAKRRIEEMLDAGRRLSQFRREQFDFSEDAEDDGSMDPTRRPGYDLADASVDAREVAGRLKAQAKAKAEADAKAKAEAAEREKADLAELAELRKAKREKAPE